ncbi:MAG: SecDF P1 head subdomain-containing protein, partial [Planctomycetaceae bacterium]
MSYFSLAGWTLLAQDTASTAAAAAPAPAADVATSAGLLLTFVALVFVLPFILGTLIARLLNMREITTRLTVVIFSFLLGLTPMLYQVVQGNSWKDCFNLGIDLAGGTNLVYQIDADEADRLGKKIDSQLIMQMVGAIIRRINPSGTEEVTVRQVGADRIEVIIPGDDPELVQQKKNAMTRLGSLEFCILANQKNHAALIASSQGIDDVRQDGRVVASWLRVAGERLESDDSRIAVRDVTRDGKVVGQEALVVIEPNEERRITGRYLKRAHQTNDENGAPAVGFDFNQRGGFLFGDLTRRNQPETDGFYRRLAILLDNEIHSAPRINDVISDSGIISGRFTQDEINEWI